MANLVFRLGHKHDQGSKDVPSAGSGEALGALEASFAGSAEHLSALRLSGGSQHLHLGLAWCAALGTVIFLPGVI